jgi:hypothetical protein
MKSCIYSEWEGGLGLVPVCKNTSICLIRNACKSKIIIVQVSQDDVKE